MKNNNTDGFMKKWAFNIFCMNTATDELKGFAIASFLWIFFYRKGPGQEEKV